MFTVEDSHVIAFLHDEESAVFISLFAGKYFALIPLSEGGALLQPADQKIVQLNYKGNRPNLTVKRSWRSRRRFILVGRQNMVRQRCVMLMNRLPIFIAAIGLLPSIALFGQSAAKAAGGAFVSPDGTILNAPYSAKRHFTSVTKRADGRVDHSKSVGSEARDSRGRTYSAGERQWTYFDGKENVLKSEMLYRIDDPVANTETKWDTTTRVVNLFHRPQSVSKEMPPEAECQAFCDDAGTVVEKLGVKSIGGVLAEGTRSSYTVPVGQDQNSKPLVVVDERWFCPELRIVVLETNDDPRSGNTRNELIDITHGEPDITQYRPPADYAIREVNLSW